MSDTYIPDRPCKNGHLLRYERSRACVECCKAKGSTPERREYYRKQRAADPERFRAYTAKWNNNNPAKRLYDGAKYRASQFDLEFDLEPSDVVIPEMCPVFGTPMKKPNLDRRDNSKGYIKGNIHVISGRANRIKSDATKVELEALVRYMSLTDLNGSGTGA